MSVSDALQLARQVDPQGVRQGKWSDPHFSFDDKHLATGPFQNQGFVPLATLLVECYATGIYLGAKTGQDFLMKLWFILITRQGSSTKEMKHQKLQKKGLPYSEVVFLKEGVHDWNFVPRFVSSRFVPVTFWAQIHWCHHQNRYHGPGHRCCEDAAGPEEKLFFCLKGFT